MKLFKTLLCALTFALVSIATASAQEIGTTYCTSLPNSTGQAAVLSAYGVPDPSGLNVALLVTDCPPGQGGILFFGQNQASLPFADGTLCISSANGGITRIEPPLFTDAQGTALHWLTAAETYPGPGGNPAQDTMNYQFWFRDGPAGNTGSNLSSAVEIEFLPCVNCK